MSAARSSESGLASGEQRAMLASWGRLSAEACKSSCAKVPQLWETLGPRGLKATACKILVCCIPFQSGFCFPGSTRTPGATSETRRGARKDALLLRLGGVLWTNTSNPRVAAAHELALPGVRSPRSCSASARIFGKKENLQTLEAWSPVLRALPTHIADLIGASPQPGGTHCEGLDGSLLSFSTASTTFSSNTASHLPVAAYSYTIQSAEHQFGAFEL